MADERGRPGPDREEPWEGPEHGGWVAPGSTPTDAARGPAPHGGEKGSPPPHVSPGPGAAVPARPGAIPPAGPEGGATGGGPTEPTDARQWWGADDAEPFAIEQSRQLSPRSMVVGPINQLKNLLLPILFGLVVGGFNPVLLFAAGVTIIGLLVLGFVTWRTVRYEVGPDRLEIRRGLIRRSRRTIPLERVRGVDVTSTLLHRLLGVAVVRIEAASGAGGESEDGKLDAVDAVEAERLRRVLLHRREVLQGRTGAEGEPGTGQERAGGEGEAAPTMADAAATYFTMPRSWYLYGALSIGYLFTPFVALSALFGLVQQTAGPMATDFFVDWVTDSDWGFLIASAAAFAAVLVLTMPVFAVVSYTVTHWRFTLRGRDGSLVAERGLFTLRSVALEKRRIRGYELLDNPLERTRDAVRLRAIVTGLGDTANRAVLLPLGPRRAVRAVVDQALTPFRGSLVPHPRAALYRRMVRSVGPFAVAAAAALAVGVPWAAGAAAVFALLGVPLGLDRYRSLGHGFDGELVSVRSGSLRRGQATVERSAVIGWTWTQTLFQRRSSLADIQVTVGAGAGGYTAQDASLEGAVAFAARVTPEMVRPFLVGPADPTDSAGPTSPH